MKKLITAIVVLLLVAAAAYAAPALTFTLEGGNRLGLDESAIATFHEADGCRGTLITTTVLTVKGGSLSASTFCVLEPFEAVRQMVNDARSEP